MIWLFLAVVLVLLVCSPGFRRVAAWLTGAAAVVAAVFVLVVYLQDRRMEKAAEGAPVPAWEPPSDVCSTRASDGSVLIVPCQPSTADQSARPGRARR